VLSCPRPAFFRFFFFFRGENAALLHVSKISSCCESMSNFQVAEIPSSKTRASRLSRWIHPGICLSQHASAKSEKKKATAGNKPYRETRSSKLYSRKHLKHTRSSKKNSLRRRTSSTVNS
jgi:hypothetical protein